MRYCKTDQRAGPAKTERVTPHLKRFTALFVIIGFRTKKYFYINKFTIFHYTYQGK